MALPNQLVLSAGFAVVLGAAGCTDLATDGQDSNTGSPVENATDHSEQHFPLVDTDGDGIEDNADDCPSDPDPGGRMAKQENSPGIPLPRGWPRRVKSAMLNVIALAQYATVCTRSWAIKGRIARVGLKAEKDELRQELALLAEERYRSLRLSFLILAQREVYSTLIR